jgi:hypothetical protein
MSNPHRWPAAVAACVLLLGAPQGASADEAPAKTPGAGAWVLPEPESCAPSRGLIGAVGAAEDVTVSVPFAPGDVVAHDRAELLRSYLPDFVWELRERFFYDGMRLEIGPCFRDYGAPFFFSEATERFRARPRLTDEGGLEGYTAGLPFPPDGISRKDPQAGLKWLWNVAQRYQGTGFHGRFRMTDLVGSIGRAEPFEGEMFKILLAHRSDLAHQGYVAPGARGKQFVAGGLFHRPFDAREYAWRQFRDVEHLRSPGRSDDLHAYLPQWRRVRRISASRVEGLYMPSFAVGVMPTQTLAVGGGAGGDAGGMAAAGAVGGTIAAKRSGYEGLEMRPLLWAARVLGLHDVLAPIAASTPSYPENPDRDFGPWGISFASDRWDLRRALVLELTAVEATGGDRDARQIMYVDLQTLHPLYIATYDGRDERTNVGMYVGRWSEDRPDYPRWPDDPERPVRIIDSVGAAFANLVENGSWRRESWGNVGTPPPDATVKRMVSVNELTKRR